MPKKEISGGRRRQRKTRLRARKGKMARAQGIAIWGSRGWLPIQSNPIQSNPSHLSLHMENPFSSFHISLERLFTSFAQLVAANRRVERASLGSPNDNFKEGWKGAAAKGGLNAGLLWPRSRVFVIIPPIFAFNLLCASCSSIMRQHATLSWKYPWFICCAYPENARIISMLSLRSASSLSPPPTSVMTEKIHVHPRIRFRRACSLAGVVSFKGIVEPSFSESTGAYRAMDVQIGAASCPTTGIPKFLFHLNILYCGRVTLTATLRSTAHTSPSSFLHSL
jgi:hypothetical protein